MEHGACDALNGHSKSCSGTSHSENENKSETSSQACGCASLFVPISNHIVISEFSKSNFVPLILRVILNVFSQRIERPPISIS
jgi:hypothetical protein